MSGKATGWAWEQDVRCVEKIILLALADHSDDRGVSWPGIERLAMKTGQSERTVQRALGSLEIQKLLHREERSRRGRQIVHYILEIWGDRESKKGDRESKKGDRESPDPIRNQTGKEEETGGGFAFWEATWKATVGGSVTILLVSDLQGLGRKHGVAMVQAELEEMARRGGRSIRTLTNRLEDRAAGKPWGKQPRGGAQASASRPKCGVEGKPCPPGAGGHLKGCHYYAGGAS